MIGCRTDDSVWCRGLAGTWLCWSNASEANADSDHHRPSPTKMPSRHSKYAHTKDSRVQHTPHINVPSYHTGNSALSAPPPPPHSNTMGLFDDKSRLLQVTWYTCMATSIAVRFS